jgi:hypothetical protein
MSTSAQRTPSFSRTHYCNETNGHTCNEQINALLDFIQWFCFENPVDLQTCRYVIGLTGKKPSNITVLYIGTATYDLASSKATQTRGFAAEGCTVTEIKCASATPPHMGATVAEVSLTA